METTIRLISTPFGRYLYDPWSGSLTLLGELEKRALEPLIKSKLPDESIVINETAHEMLESAGIHLGNRVEKVAYPSAREVLRKLDRSLNLMILQITQQCNLRCEYCIYSADNSFNRSHSNITMTFAVAKAAIDYLKTHSVDSKQVTIGLYGGEPFLHFDLIKKIVSYADTVFAGKKVVYHVTTNGTLLNEEIIDFLIEMKSRFHVLFSLDGPEVIQDNSRRFPNGAGTYDTVLRGIRKLVDRCPEYRELLRFNSVVDTTKEYADLTAPVDEEALRGAKFQFNYVEENGMPAPFSSCFVENHEYDMFLGYVAHFRDKARNYPNMLIKHEFHHIVEGIKRFVPKSPTPISVPAGVCQPGLTRLFVTATGDLFPCERVDETSACMKIGNIYDGFNNEAIVSMLNVASLCESKCLQCWAFNLCSSCVKRFDGGGSLSADGIECSCAMSRRTAAARLEQVILLNENERHERLMQYRFSNMFSTFNKQTEEQL